MAEPDATTPAAEEQAPPESPQKSMRFLPMPMPSAPFWLVLIASISLVLILIASWSVIFTFAIGLVLVFLFLPIVDWLNQHGLGRTLASGIMVLVMVVIVVLLILLGIAIVINQGIPFIKAIPGFLEDTVAQVKANDPPEWIESAFTSIGDAISTAFANFDAGTFFLGFLQGVIGFIGFLCSLLVIPFFVFYAVRDQPAIAASFYDGVPVPWRTHVETVVRIFKDDFADYFKAEIIVGGIMGVVVAAGAFIIGLIVGAPNGLTEFALLLGLIAAMLELLPTIGPIISYFPALLISLTISPLAVILVTIFYLLAFQLEGSILVPTIEGKVISFRPATVLFLIAVGFGLGGILGAIVALPVAAILRDMFSHFFRHAEQEALIPDSS
jgi:predicted PurR-regulated permease PerM